MKKEDLKIVYMGTPDFAVEGLKVLVEGGYNIVGVITMPDKPIGRHQDTLQPSPVKQYAVEHGLKVLQPAKLKDPDFVEELRSLNADLQIVVAFRMLPEIVWSMPKYGTFNAHASLLPKYRGAAPINWAVINGDTETGMTTFMLKHEIDTGDVIDQVRIPIADTDNVEIVHDKLMALSGTLIIKTVDSILDGTLKTISQEELIERQKASNTQMTEEEMLAPAPKIFRETCQIDWNQTTKRIYDFIRGLSPYPAAWTSLNGKSVKIYDTEKETADHSLTPGTILSDGKTYIKAATKDGYINIKVMQLEGKKRMPVTDLLRGFKLTDNAQFV
ncbi:MAG: methionyl-tRNA formyltransferase [Bacteroidaceae bacterium]|nr:methionyl-tRNA formyltransferase [Bacteroidaceae bacterium]